MLYLRVKKLYYKFYRDNFEFFASANERKKERKNEQKKNEQEKEKKLNCKK